MSTVEISPGLYFSVWHVGQGVYAGRLFVGWTDGFTRDVGNGTVEDIIARDVLVLVRYDETPHVRYNMGENPTVSLLYDLKVLHDDLP